MPVLEHIEAKMSSRVDYGIPNLIAFHAKYSPDAIAITAPGRSSLTYHQLHAQLTKIQTQLTALGICRQDRVAIMLPNGPEMAVAFLGVASTATSAPLNPAYRGQECEFYLMDLNAKALLIQADLESPAREVARAFGIPILELTPRYDAGAGMFSLMTTHEGNAPIVKLDSAHPQDVALMLHTSGTTSRPKLVPLTHENLVISAQNIVSTLQLTEKDRCLNIMPLFHIHGLVGALLASLSSGGSVVCTSGCNPNQFFDWLRECHPTWYTAVPTMHQAILAQIELQPECSILPPLRFIRSSSAALPPPVFEALEQRFHCPVIEAYGMTEAAHQMASNPLPPKARKPGSVGLAAGPKIAILDEQGTVQPGNQLGEVAIRGLNVMGGYEHHPTANEMSFTRGWFRTGDQGYVDENGYLFLTGRLKEMINRGGEKIAPREIDDQLLAHPAIAQAVTFALPHSTLGEDVAAAVVLNAETNASPQEIQEFLRERLADFKIPRTIVILTEIPKGPTGKIQRIGLADKLADQLNPPHVSPIGVVETIVAGLFETLLTVDQVGISDNFFALGGDSLRATQVASRLNALLHLEVDAVTIFEHPTVSGLSQKMSSMMDPAEISALSDLLEHIDDTSLQEAEEPRT